MNLFKKLLIWSLIAASIESVLLFSLNKIYAKPLDSYKEVKSLPQAKKKEYNDVKIPENAENIKISYDGKYISYYEDKVLKIANAEDESNNSIDTSNNGSVCYSKWLPDSNLLLLCEKDNKNKINFFSYNADKDIKKEVTDFDMKPLKIEMENKTDIVDNITISTSNHVMYIKVLHKNRTSDIYKINIMNQVEKMKISNDIIGNISMLYNDTNLIYEDIGEEEIKNITTTMTKNSKTGKEKEITKISNIEIDNEGRKVLLGTDEEDKVYIGTLEKNKVNKILFGDLKTPSTEWKILKLPELIDRKDIIITKEGSIYVNDKSKGSIRNM